MAIQRHNTTFASPQTPAGNVLNGSRRRFRFDLDCNTADDVRARATMVRAWRGRMWPSWRPLPPAPPQPVPAPDASNPLETLPLALIDAADNDNAFGVAMPGRITVRNVVELTAAHFKVEVEALTSHRRTHPLVRHRQVAAYVARQTTARSLSFIGRKMGRDHTTILHAVRTVQARIDAGDGDTIAAVNAIVERMGVSNV
jgi:hypothetical protein